MSAAGEAPAAFDAAAFVADLVGADVLVGIAHDVPRGGEKAGPSFYFVRSRDGQGLGDAYTAVLDWWRPAMLAHPNYGDRVFEYLTSRPAVFDPALFVAELEGAGCSVVLSQPGTCFKVGDDVASWFVRPARGYTRVMDRWADAMQADPDHVERVTALLVERWEAGR